MKRVILVLKFLFLSSGFVLADIPENNYNHLWGAKVGAGWGSESTTALRMGLVRKWNNEWFKSRFGFVSGYFEGSANYWNNGDDDSAAFTITPVLSYQHTPADGAWFPYIEAGIGVAWLIEEKIDDHDMGLKFQFEDLFGLGVRFGADKQHDINLRVIHYSNASISDHNPGIEFLFLTYEISF